MPPSSAIGFAPADWLLFLVTAIFLFSLLAWRPRVAQAFELFAAKTGTCMLLLFLLPIALRLLLLPHHPVPIPESGDEFSHLLLADTLLQGRLANPPHALHQFFETSLVLQQPTYSSIYPPGVALTLAVGRLLTGLPWAGVLITTGLFCATCYWMLRAWVAPAWALLGGILAVVEFGPLCRWTNWYGGGPAAAACGCLIFGALPRLRLSARPRDAVLLGCGLGMHMLMRPFESILLLGAVALFSAPLIMYRWEWPKIRQLTLYVLMTVLAAIGLLLLQNKAVTRSWALLPAQLSQYQYGVPAPLTILPNITPHVLLSSEQQRDYATQVLIHGNPPDSLTKFGMRLLFSIRYYRFFFLPPLYLVLVAFFFSVRERRLYWIVATLAIFAMGANLLPSLEVQNVAAETCLFVLVSIIGLQQLARVRIRGTAAGLEMARVLILLCLAEFTAWYTLHLFENPAVYPILQYETWDSIDHAGRGAGPGVRRDVAKRLAALPGQLLVFVRYAPHHNYQNEWVWNAADIDASRIVFARDLGQVEDQKLIQYYPNRRVLLLEPDDSVVRLAPY